MKKFTFYYLIGLFGLFLSIFLFRSLCLSWLLTTDFRIPIKCSHITLSYPHIAIKNFRVYNPKKFEKTKSLTIKNLLFSLPSSYNPWVIDLVEMNGIDLFVEVNANGENNWSKILNENYVSSKNNRKYLIKKLVLKNMRVSLKEKGQPKKTYPMIDEIVIENVSNTSGYAFNHIERAIAQAMIKKIFPIVGIQKLIETPLKIIPKIFPFLNKSSAQGSFDGAKKAHPTYELQQPQK